MRVCIQKIYLAALVAAVDLATMVVRRLLHIRGLQAQVVIIEESNSPNNHRKRSFGVRILMDEGCFQRMTRYP